MDKEHSFSAFSMESLEKRALLTAYAFSPVVYGTYQNTSAEGSQITIGTNGWDTSKVFVGGTMDVNYSLGGTATPGVDYDAEYQSGVITVVRAGPMFRIVAQNDMEEPMTASPVISGGRIYLRTFEALYAVGL